MASNKSCANGLTWLSVVFVVISGAFFSPERRLIHVKQQPCSVRSERDVGTYVEFCGLPEKLGGSSNNNNNNNNSKAVALPLLWLKNMELILLKNFDSYAAGKKEIIYHVVV